MCCFDFFGFLLGIYIFDSIFGNVFKYSFDKVVLVDFFVRYVFSKWRIYILFLSFCNYLDLFSILIGLKICLNLFKYVMLMISFKIKCEKFVVLVNVY